jgi:crotonobetainyl-CoA:carnitine CoA-transferase CaiB-like acyl-CoA transferase
LERSITNGQQVNSALWPYRVLDLTEGGCMIGARILGDLGADVIKIEPPGGSLSRIAPFYRDLPDPEKSLYWFAYNVNKKGIILDMNCEEGKIQFRKLVETADIIMESSPAGYMERLGFGYPDLCKIKKDIILTSITPFGQSGPKSNYRGSDLTAWASGSYLSACGNPDREPTWISFPQAFLFGGAEAAVGSMTALWHRLNSGEGQHVDVSLQECAMSPTLNIIPTWDVSKMNFKRNGGSYFVPTSGVRINIYYRCKDGCVLIITQGGNEPFVGSTKRLVEWMDEEKMAPDWLKQLDFAVDLDAATMKQELMDRVAAEVEKFTLTKTKAVLYEEGAMKRRILVALLSTTEDICNNPQLKSRNYWYGIYHHELKESVTYCGPFTRLSETPITYTRRAPLIGEHNREIFYEDVALSGREVPAARNERIVNRGSKEVFEGIKVAEFAWAAVGPCSSRYFADHGATVIKIESHKRLDTLRVTSPFGGGKPDEDRSVYFGRHNANKYSVSLDVNTPNGLKLAWKLVMWADIVTESYSPRVMEKWGLDYDSVKKVRPDIIYLSSSMQGRGGPHAHYIGYGTSACALGGFSEVSGWPDRMPAAPHGAYTDYIAPRFNATALIAALEYRRRTGKGQWLEQSQFETSLHFFAPPVMDYMVNGRIMGRQGNRVHNAAPHGVFPCKGDDRWVAVAVLTDSEWQSFCRAIGYPIWTKNDHFSTLAERKAHEDELEKLVGEWTINYSAEAAEEILQSAGVTANMVARPSDLYEDPQLAHRHYFTRLKQPKMGEQAFETQACFILSKTPRKVKIPSPCLGEHNNFVFRDMLGLSEQDIAGYIKDGSITTRLPGTFKYNM